MEVVSSVQLDGKVEGLPLTLIHNYFPNFERFDWFINIHGDINLTKREVSVLKLSIRIFTLMFRFALTPTCTSIFVIFVDLEEAKEMQDFDTIFDTSIGNTLKVPKIWDSLNNDSRITNSGRFGHNYDEFL
ncbi:unnamed protein product [Lactuca virosa]|uniref:Uncharacterized protein n=1 Tax=Lactuca virosa TaxID=75947 RepID=A0AAU9P8P0_9ASTR|nr:unnamed protein product [Lactuca virosa]